MCGTNNPQMRSDTAMYNRELEANRPEGSARGLLGLFLAAKKKSTGGSQVQSLPPQRSSPPSGGPTRLGIRRSSSARKRSVASGRSRSKRKAFSRG
jgi:hypothetical protein